MPRCDRSINGRNEDDDISSIAALIQTAPADEVESILKEVAAVIGIDAISRCARIACASGNHGDAVRAILWLQALAEGDMRDMAGRKGH